MLATLNSILSGFSVENSHVTDSTVVPTAFTIGFRYSRLYCPCPSCPTSNSVNWSAAFSKFIFTSPESPLPENSACDSDAEIIR